jgi:succinate dehydrogenase flavin-adding protein (antitoxin of CptAB toxin-antitoxin module)
VSRLSSTSDSLRNNNLEIRRRRLLFRCGTATRRRSTSFFGSFVETTLTGFDNASQDRFEVVLDCAEPSSRCCQC